MEELMRIEWIAFAQLYYAPGAPPLGKGEIAALPLADARSLIARGWAIEARTEISVALAEGTP